MKTVFSDLSLDIDVDNLEAMKQLAPAVEDTFVVQSILMNLANRDNREGYRQVICQLTPKLKDPVVLVHAVSKGMYDGLAQDLEMFSAVDSLLGQFQSTPSCIALIADHFLALPGAGDVRSYVGRIVDHCLKVLPEGLIYELAVKHELPASTAFWLVAPYLNSAHRGELLVETKDMEKAWWLIRNFGGLTQLAMIKNAIKDRRVRAAVDAFIAGNTLGD